MRCAQIALVLLLCVALTLSKGLGSKDGKEKDEPPQYKFGDIISSTDKNICGVTITKHYVVYLGKGKIEGLEDKTDDQDIFHRWEYDPQGCRFGVLSKGSNLEKVADYAKTTSETTTEKMKARIKQLLNDCGQYHLLDNNCEQTATYVRYNEKIMSQSGTPAGSALQVCPGGIRLCHRFYTMVANAVEWMRARTQCPDINNNNN